MQTDFGHPECLGTSISFMLLSSSFSTFYRHCGLFFGALPSMGQHGYRKHFTLTAGNGPSGSCEEWDSPRLRWSLCLHVFTSKKSGGAQKNVKMIPARGPKQCGGVGG